VAPAWLLFYELVVLTGVLPFLGLWMLYGVYVIWRHPERRVRQAIQISYAFATLAAIALVIAGWTADQLPGHTPSEP
jgi:hypothetical protein